MEILSPFLLSQTFSNMTLKSVEISTLYEIYINWGILRNF